MKLTGFERKERHDRRALVVNMVNDLVKQGISISRIALRAKMSRSSIYKVCCSERCPSEKMLNLLTDYYFKVFQIANQSNDSHEIASYVNRQQIGFSDGCNLSGVY